MRGRDLLHLNRLASLTKATGCFDIVCGPRGAVRLAAGSDGPLVVRRKWEGNASYGCRGE
jgi:hypothetical protein